MIELTEITAQNWLDAARLAVADNQKRFLDSAQGILARGYVYRREGACVLGIAEDGQLLGLLLCKGLDEEPACYDLQQFMIDARFQNRGCGAQALRELLDRLARERRYDNVEVCVHRDNRAALGLFAAAGFIDTGYLDPDAPDCVNLRYALEDPFAGCRDTLLQDFTDPLFRSAFRRYFQELDIAVEDYDALFAQMDADAAEGAAAFLRTSPEGRAVGFILGQPMALTGWFFEGQCGFLREFWVAEEYRRRGHGAALLSMLERHFVREGLPAVILTTDTAAAFYEKRGYARLPAWKAKNGLDVLFKSLIYPE